MCEQIHNSSPVPLSTNPSISQFAGLLVAAMRRRFGAALNSIACPAPHDRLIGELENGLFDYGIDLVHKEYLSLADLDRSVHIRDAVEAIAAIADRGGLGTYESVRAWLRPVLQSPMNAHSLLVEHGLQLLSRPFGADRVIQVVVDVEGETGIATVTGQQAQAWGVDLDRLLMDALDNLRDLSSDPLSHWVLTPMGFIVANWQDAYAASRMLLPYLFAELPLQGRPVALAAAAEMLAIASEEDVASQLAMLSLAPGFLKERGHHIAASLLVLDDGVWTPFTPVDPAVRRAQELLAMDIDLIEYRKQESLLALWARQRPDLHHPMICMFDVRHQASDQNCTSSTVWSEGGHQQSSLPRAEVLVFVSVDHEGRQLVALSVPFESALAVVGEYMTLQLECQPTRYLVGAHPPPAKMAELRHHAL